MQYIQPGEKFALLCLGTRLWATNAVRPRQGCLGREMALRKSLVKNWAIGLNSQKPQQTGDRNGKQKWPRTVKCRQREVTAACRTLYSFAWFLYFYVRLLPPPIGQSRVKVWPVNHLNASDLFASKRKVCEAVSLRGQGVDEVLGVLLEGIPDS